MAFTSWCDEYQKYKDAHASRKATWLFNKQLENQRQMELGYQGPMQVASYMQWLASKCAEETYGDGIEGQMFGCALGGSDA